MLGPASTTESIAALASAPGGASRGIIRLSGPSVLTLIGDWAVDLAAWPPQVPTRYLADLPIHDQFLDTIVRIPAAMHVWPNHRSYTGEPVVELHLPGSPPLLERVLEEVYRRGARPARPGEFTLRAFLAGKLDLLQAEAVLGVIDAHDHRELTTALGQLAGGVSRPLATLRETLVDLLAELEAGLDFVDEGLEFISRDHLSHRVQAIGDQLQELWEQTNSRMHTRDRPRVVLAGLPNAGKSTLFNALLDREAAIVSPIPGTTRDFLQAAIDIDGVPCELIDTAGWEETQALISDAAQQHRGQQIEQADLLVWCTAADATPAEQTLDETWRQRLQQIVTQHGPLLRIVTKADQAPAADRALPAAEHGEVLPHLRVSAATGAGLNTLRSAIAAMLEQPAARGQWLGMTAARCRHALREARDATSRLAAGCRDPLVGDELLAIDLRLAIDALGTILGAVYTDDLLDRIFSKFCIGK